MCYPEKCPRCGKTGWAGCGQHVDDVMSSVPSAQRCTCGESPGREPRSGGAEPPVLLPFTRRSGR
jgi:hypothetical protein